MNEIDPWLYPGCPCLVWRDKDEYKTLAFFKKIGDYNLLYFIPNNNLNEIAIPYKNYKPISPWDFAPPEAAFIRIDSLGNCEFLLNENDTHSISAKILCESTGNIIMSSYYKILIPWPACPDVLKSKTWPRPKWAKE